MKKTLLSLAVIASGFWAQSQVICAGVSPANIVGNYEHTWADPAGGDWATPDYLIPGNFIIDTLMMIDDGTPGLNAQGNPIGAEGCAGSPAAGSPPASSSWNDLTGKIAVIYRNTCEFGYKALQAQNAGAVGVIIINREDAMVNMGGGAEGLNVTIPVFFISSVSGAIITAEMSNGPVVMFLGNKVGAFANDVGSNSGAALISPYGGANNMIFDGFDLGIEIYNFGSNSQSNTTVNAKITGPTGTVYDQTVNAPAMNTGDTLSIFNGNPVAFPSFDLGGIGNYPDGDYTLEYTIDLGVTDDSDYDNVFTSWFTVQGDVISLAQIDGSGNPAASSYPSNSTTEYSSCMFFEDANVAGMGVDQITFVPYTDTSQNNLAGAEIFINVFLWNDGWTDLADPTMAGAANNDWFQALSQIAVETHYPSSNTETGQPVTVPFSNPIILASNQRYLFCLQSFDPVIAFGYDGALNYDGNQAITAMPIGPVNVDATWYTGGWIGPSATSMSLHLSGVGLNETNVVDGKAFPNPAKDIVTVAVEANGDAVITVTDVAGRVVMTESVELVNGTTQVNINALESGVYVFNVALENGQTSQFNVVKK